ncbi:hypothetical protein ACFQ48_02700 [Hymenobacter caeli]|uniref:Uncharacterized protein n=1 Tax=Hymenobacter caeli TaxID=2735894 RepID=A0ABX2FMP4_9BACT|nr:hypothetical protein [Hymenobacter caeli]NRT17732.1 hypothetical protein [Hymenobacter caeli]
MKNASQRPASRASRANEARPTAEARAYARSCTPYYDWSGNYSWTSTTELATGLRLRPCSYQTTATDADCCIATCVSLAW